MVDDGKEEFRFIHFNLQLLEMKLLKDKTQWHRLRKTTTCHKKAIDPKIAEFVMNYFMMKRQVREPCLTKDLFRHLLPSGVWMILTPDTYSHYGHIMKLYYCTTKNGKETGLSLYPTYAYARIYKNGYFKKT